MNMQQQALVSIIIPTLNSEKYIHRCLTALQMQTYVNLEILVVDAGSTDGTFAIIDSFQSKLNIECFNIGKSTQSEARNYGIEHATGDFIAFCDSDDFYLPEKIAKQIQLMETQSLDVSYCNVLHFYTDQPDKFFLNQHIDTGDILADCIAFQTINLNAIIVRKSFLLTHSLRFPDGDLGRYGEDGNFIFQLAVHQAHFALLAEALSVVEVRKDSHTQWEIQWKMKLCAIQYRLDAAAKIPVQYQDLLKKTLDSLQWKLVISYWIARKFPEADAVILKLSPKNAAFLMRKLNQVLRYLPQQWVFSTLTKLWAKRQQHIRHVYPTLTADLRTDIKTIFG